MLRPSVSSLPIVLVALSLSVLVSCAKDNSTEPIGGEAASTVKSDAGAQSGTQSKPPAGDATAEAAIPAEPPQPELSTDEIAGGWIQLFDGISLFGWHANNDVNWSVRDGVIHADTGEPGLLLTAVPFADYELRCDFLLEKGGNSGIFLRTVENPADPATDCYELNICDTHPEFTTGSLVGRAKILNPVETEGQWQTFHVVAEGPRLQVSLNGNPLLDFTDDADPPRLTGLIGLQKNAGAIQFRRIHLKPLGARPLITGSELDAWQVVPGSKSRFELRDGTIHVTDGPGFLETRDAWADFVLQAEIRTNGKHLNSGIFFRALPGTEEAPSHGYEMQIHNGYKDGDRRQPMDAGTGAIFRRTKARWVIPDDNEWFTATLIAHHDRFAAWVNGIGVTDWIDTREPHENPRQGRRLAAGHISLQGHDPTTDLSFRNIRVAPIGSAQAE